MTVLEWIDEFLLHLKQSGRSAHTMRQYGWHLRRLNSYLDERGIETPEEVDRPILRRWGASLTDKWAPATQRQAVAAARAFFRFLAEEGVTEGNPAMTLALPNVPTRQQRTLSAEEIIKLLHTAENLSSPHKERESALVLFLTDSGLRAGETCGLMIEEVDLVKGSLCLLGKGKKSEEPAYFGTTTTEYLNAWLSIRREWLAARDLSDPGTLFIALGGIHRGHPLTTRGLRSILFRLGEKAGIEGVSPHAFRRAFATLLTSNGAPTRVTQVLGRWSKVEMVERYTGELSKETERRNLHSLFSPVDRLQLRQMRLRFWSDQVK